MFVSSVTYSLQGSIVFVSSVTGFVPALGIGPYSVSKAALMSLTKGLAAEVKLGLGEDWILKYSSLEIMKHSHT